jgi:integrase
MAVVTLTDAYVRNIKPGSARAEYWDAKVSGLCLRITPTGAASWTFRYRPQGSTSFKRLKLGAYPEVSLATARERAWTQRADISGGADPAGAIRSRREQAARVLTFGKLADQFIENYAKRHKKTWAMDEWFLRKHVLDDWRDRPVGKITRADTAALLDKIAANSASSANRTHNVLAKIFNWAVDSGLIEAGPMNRMRKRAKETPKERTLSPGEIRVLWHVTTVWTPVTAAAFRLLLLSGQRPGEISQIRLDYLHDLDGPRPRVEFPFAVMKGGKAHVLPLAPMALEIVKERLATATEGQTHLFPSPMGRRASIAVGSVVQAMERVIDALVVEGLDAAAIRTLKAARPTAHDCRRTVATNLSALGILREDRKAVLGQAQNDVHARHYDKYDRFAEKLRALGAWEEHVAQIIKGRGRK